MAALRAIELCLALLACGGVDGFSLAPAVHGRRALAPRVGPIVSVESWYDTGKRLAIAAAKDAHATTPAQDAKAHATPPAQEAKAHATPPAKAPAAPPAKVSLQSAVAAASLPGPRAYKAYDEAIALVKLGTSDLLVSSCCLGTMTWGNQNTDAEAAAQLDLAWDRGVNFLDTAECYPVPVSQEKQGATDRAIAKWLQSNGRAREEVIIASKVCGYNERFTWLRDDGEPTRVTREQIFASVDASLKRLQVDR
tara:strand:- start:926 stop:1681 length:756 start_codon:yes stop_codon:yes gene_type:complete